MCIIIWMGRNVGWKFQYYFTVEKLKGLGCFCFKYNCDTCQFIVGKIELLSSNVLFLPEKLKGWGCV